jgi:DNA-binding MarR family transcriptional regulator
MRALRSDTPARKTPQSWALIVSDTDELQDSSYIPPSRSTKRKMHSRRRTNLRPDNDHSASEGPSAWLGFLLNNLGERLRTLTYESLKPWGLAARDFGALESVAAFGPLSQIELGRIIGMDRTSVVQLVDRLEQAGWMTRQINPQDRRVHLLQLTADGLVRLEALRKLASEAEQELTRGLSPAELSQVKAALRRLL